MTDYAQFRTKQGILTMDRTTNRRPNGPKLGLIMTTALAGVALTGCTASAAPQAETSFSKAQAALESGKVDKAVMHAEAAVLAEPRNPGFRALLGAAYLEAGRFEAAATSFNDALDLGDSDPRTVLSYALAKTALGDGASAVAVLEQYERAIDPADYGLALALAGNPEKGVHVLVNALRGGENSAKMRQNLAYSYALAGNWRAARVMAAEDVPADQLDARLSDWAATAKPEDVQVRVANLLNVTPSNAGGQPTQLALANFPSQQTMVAEAAAQADIESVAIAEAPAAPSEAETLAFGLDQTADAPVARVAAAVPAPAPAARAPARRYVSNPVVQKVPARASEERAAPTRVARKSSQRRMAATSVASSSDKAAGTHLVQLGSFDSRAVAKAKWSEFQQRFPQLKDHDVVITKAEVNGRVFYRVAAAGFGVRSARAMCGTAKSSGVGCFAYTKSNPPKGAIDDGVRIAARTR
ncbi:tetratricopeptide repeat protein [Erythrobacter sp. JK5]|uniref:SPOR domain-containing protein n=1 Tax=Erythrobacter sp. JK5 TaxID=2829500 RepID=UPI001BAD428C|nr:tetratricopeptide repeat protein [Erythrobacter sp. JK5]QUL36673.1 tetratricopeptide repeat protein [Erythrobacter sp. JK5]